MSIKSKLGSIIMCAAFIAGSKLMKWLEKPEVKEQTAAERKLKRKVAFRAVQSDAFKAKHPMDSRQPEFTVDNGHRRRYTDIID